jgi:hypothetical protein
MGGPHARAHANVVLTNAHQRLEQGKCEASNLSAVRLRQGARFGGPGSQTAWDAPAKRGAEPPAISAS